MNSYKIDGPWSGELAIVTRPRGGELLADDLQQIRNEFDLLVSLLTPGEVDEFDLAPEPEISKRCGLEFISWPVRDLGVPHPGDDFRKLLDDLTEALETGKRLAIHCSQGIGRSGLLAAMLLVSADIDPQAAIRRVSEARGLPVPDTLEQKQWIIRFAEDFVDTLANR